jgi:hypothetical protein
LVLFELMSLKFKAIVAMLTHFTHVSDGKRWGEHLSLFSVLFSCSQWH